MQVLYPQDLHARKQYRLHAQRQRKRRRLGVRLMSWVLLLVLVIGGLAGLGMVRAIEPTEPSLMAISQKAVAPLDLPWPNYGQAAVGAVGYGALDVHNTDKPVPTASTAKIFTALMVMKAKPLKPGQQGPLITVSDADIALYQKYVAVQGSVYPVAAGQQISEYQALQAMLLVSANNIADMLAIWAYGSMDAYTTAANQYLKSVGLTNTTVADGSGFMPQTKSTAKDLTIAAGLLMNNDVLAAIVGQKNMDIPGIGPVPGTNTLLGSNGVLGVKTGNTDEAGGCFVIAVQHAVDATHTVIIVGAVLGAPDVPAAMQASLRLVNDAKLGFSVQTVLAKGQTVAEYHPAWGGIFEARAEKDLAGVVWLPSPHDVVVELQPVGPKREAGAVGAASAQFGADTQAVPVITDATIPEPPLTWRLYRRYL